MDSRIPSLKGAPHLHGLSQVESAMECGLAQGSYESSKSREMTTPRKPENLREICGTKPCALLCSLVRNEYNGRYATISVESVS